MPIPTPDQLMQAGWVPPEALAGFLFSNQGNVNLASVYGTPDGSMDPAMSFGLGGYNAFADQGAGLPVSGNYVTSSGQPVFNVPDDAQVAYGYSKDGSDTGVVFTDEERAALRDDFRTRGWQGAARVAALVGGGAALGATGSGPLFGGAAAAPATTTATTFPYTAGGPVTVSPLAGGAGASSGAGLGILDSSGAIIPGTEPVAAAGGKMSFLQRIFGGGPLGGTGGIAGGGQYPTTAGATPPFFPSAASSGPKWLQMLSGGVNRMGGAMTGNAQNPYLNPQENSAMQQRMRQALATSLLMNSGPRPKGTSSPLGDVGAAMFASQQAGDQFTADALRAKMMQAQLAQAQQGAEDPAAIREMRRLGYPLTPDGFKQYNADQAKPSTTINIGEKLNEPIPIAQLDTVRLPNGQTPPIGTTYAEAREMGARVLSAEDQKRTQQADQALGILNQIEEIAIGPNGVFNEVQPGLANRAAAAIDFGLDMLDQKDPRASQYADMSQAVLAPFIKFLGETGSLAQGDVQRALGLLPRIFPLPDTGEVAKEKISELREIVTRGVTKMNSVTRQSENIPPPPPGFTLDPK
jgi:hypothetical protein